MNHLIQCQSYSSLKKQNFNRNTLYETLITFWTCLPKNVIIFNSCLQLFMMFAKLAIINQREGFCAKPIIGLSPPFLTGFQSTKSCASTTTITIQFRSLSWQNNNLILLFSRFTAQFHFVKHFIPRFTTVVYICGRMRITEHQPD